MQFFLSSPVYSSNALERAGRAAFEPCSPSRTLLRLATAPGLKLFFEGSLADIASNIEVTRLIRFRREIYSKSPQFSEKHIHLLGSNPFERVAVSNIQPSCRFHQSGFGILDELTV